MVLVGPDGVGKTSVAARITAVGGESVRYFHFRPSLRGWSDPEPGQFGMHGNQIHQSTGTMSSVARLLVNFLRFWTVFVLKILPARYFGKLVIGDRWMYGYLIDPPSMRYTAGPRLAEFVVRFVPQPDLVIGLTASPQAIIARKAELDHETIELQLERISRLPVKHLEIVSAAGDADQVAVSVLDAAARRIRQSRKVAFWSWP